jgi:tetratricopeptide (TPR) repeat protein
MTVSASVSVSLPALLLLTLISGCASLSGQAERTATPAAQTPAPSPSEAPAATTEATAPTPPPPPRPIDTAAEAQYQILVGELALRRDQPGVAARAFVTALRSNPDLELAQRATQLALRANDETLALEAAELWLRLDPSAVDAREVLLRVNLLRGRETEAARQARFIVEGHAAGVGDGFRHLALLLSRVPSADAPRALALMRPLVAEHDDDAGAHHALSMLSLRFNRLDEAEVAAAAAQARAPEDGSHALLRAGIWIRQDLIPDALALVDTTLRSMPAEERAELRLGVARVLLEAEANEEAKAQLEQVLADDPASHDAAMILGVMALNAGESDRARSLLTPLLRGPRQQEAALQLGRLAETEQRWEEALALYATVTRGGAALDAVVRRAWVLGKLDQLDDARALLQQVRDDYPQIAPRLYLAEGDLLTANGASALAVETYSIGLAEHPEDADLLYGRSLALERLGRIAEAETDLRAILSRQADDARALNALGYMLLVHTPRLDEAAPLIDQALALAPEDAAILDSKGWLLFKQGQVAEAVDWLQRAYERYPDPEVGAHLGEALWALGRKDEARAIWDAAREADPEHPVLLDTLDRLLP